MNDHPSFVLYRVIEQLPDGSCSRLYLGESRVDGSLRALKVFAASVDANFQFLAELEALLHVAHPNLIGLLDFGQTLHADQHYLAFEYFPGQDFVTASKTVSLYQFYSMLAQVCMALDALHRRGYVHGDLKPQNMLVLRETSGQINPPIVKLCDLGYAHGTSLAQWSAPRGSASYMAPELVKGARPTPRADLYSFGVVLYECLAGVTPFAGGDVGTILHRQLHEVPARIGSEALAELHPLLYTLISKNPATRPPSAAETLRLINAASPGGQFRLHSELTWLDSASDLPPVVVPAAKLVPEPLPAGGA